MIKKLLPLTATVLFFHAISSAQDIAAADTTQKQTIITDSTKIYTLHLKREIPLELVGGALTAYNFAQISKKGPSDQAYVEGLSKKDVNWFDRWGVRPYNDKAENLSYIPFYVAMPLPLIVFGADKKMRKDFFKLTFMYAEAMTITGVLYGTAVNFTNRLRPMVYSAETPMEKRLSSFSKKSFFAGHVALVATSTFFIARVFADYHPDSRYKWVYYSIAGASTFFTAYMRQAAGQHFLSDILVGTTVGTLSGILTPALHKHKIIKNQRLSVVPFGGGQSGGFTAFYRL